MKCKCIERIRELLNHQKQIYHNLTQDYYRFNPMQEEIAKVYAKLIEQNLMQQGNLVWVLSEMEKEND